MTERFRHIYTLKPGEDWAVFDGHIIVAGGDDPPRIIMPDGSVVAIEPDFTPINRAEPPPP